MNAKGVEPGQTKRLRRRVALLVAFAFCTALSAGSFTCAHFLYRPVARALQAHPIDMAVDLTTPGTYRGEFHHTFRGSHSMGAEVRGLWPGAGGEGTDGNTGSLEGRLLVCNRQGKVLREVELTEALLLNFHSGWLFGFSSLPTGTYELAIEVRKPVVGPPGARQRLVARYLFCGLEAWPSAVALLAGIVSGLMAGIFGLVLLARHVRTKLARARP